MLRSIHLVGCLVAFCASTTAIHAGIDDIVEADCAAASIPLPAETDAHTFLRRVYLDSIGRIPTVEESHAFLDSDDPEKRDHLVDTLLDSEGYTQHWFHFWADLLRVSTGSEVTRSGIVGSAYCKWIRQALRDNVPYDQMVRDLVGRRGNIWEPENAGAVGFYLRDFGMPLENFATTMQIFTGTQMGCAQCHDHPFDRWTQREFYQMAAFTHDSFTSKYPQIYRRSKGPAKSAVNTITIPMRFGSVLPREYPLKLPHDYQYDDGQPGEKIEAVTAFGDVVSAGPGEGASTFATWLTDPGNPRFTRVIVNRLWNELFGAPLVSPPLDDLRDDTEAWNPALEAELVQLMIDSGYDLRKFLAIVMKSRAYHRGSLTSDFAAGERQYFPAPYLRRMSAEQVWDSFAALITIAPDRPHYRRRAYTERYLNDLRLRAGKVCDKTPESVAAWLSTSAGSAFAKKRGKAESAEADRLLDKQKDEMAALEKFATSADGDKKQFNAWKQLHHELYRASEMETPAPRGHFLRTFGQSDRALPNNGNRDSSVPQALAILNGELTAIVGNPFSTISRACAKTESNSIEVAFLGALTRLPNENETMAAQEMTTPKLLQALLATTEFLFIR